MATRMRGVSFGSTLGSGVEQDNSIQLEAIKIMSETRLEGFQEWFSRRLFMLLAPRFLDPFRMSNV